MVPLRVKLPNLLQRSAARSGREFLLLIDRVRI